MTGFAEFALGTTASLVASCIQSVTKISTLAYFERRKVESRIEDATAEVVEPLVSFLMQEGIDERQQKLILEVTIRELEPLAVDSSALFAGSLDGQRIFDNLYEKRDFPKEIVDEGLVSTYSLLCPRVCALICQIPMVVKDWESNAWTENFKKLDAVSLDLRQLFEMLDVAGKKVKHNNDLTLSTAKKMLTQQVSMSLDLTGLRSDKPLEGKLDDFFVYPEIRERKDKAQPERLKTPVETLDHFLFKQTFGVIIGQPGSGKSTWSRWFQREVLKSNWPGLAIRHELRKLDFLMLPSLHQLVRNSLSIHLAEDITPERVSEWVSSRRLLFILDGFDEVPPKQRDSVILWAEELSVSVGSCSILLTSREVTTDHLIKLPIHWSNWNIQPFDDERIKEYVERWHAHVPLKEDLAKKASTENVLKELSGDPTIRPLTSNPLLLSTLLMVHHLDGKLPNGRSELYKRYIEGMLGLWDARRDIAPIGYDLSTRDKLNLLTAIAIHFHFQEKEQMDEAEVIEVVTKSLVTLRKNLDAEEVINFLRERSGLLVGPGTYSFIHKSVGEYLVAASIVQGTDRDPQGKRIDNLLLFANRGDDRWRVILFIWAGLTPLADLLSFIDETLKANDLSLAYGIFHDQYEKFTFEMKRGFVEELPKVNFKLLGNGPSMSWLCPGPIIDSHSYEIPTFYLTSLRDSDFTVLLTRLIIDEIVEFSDLKKTKGKYRELLWMYLAHSSNDPVAFRRCCAKIPAKLTPAESWVSWLGYCVVWRVGSFEDKGKVDNFYHEYIKSFPQQSGEIKLIILGRIVLCHQGASFELQKDEIAKLLSFLSDTGTNKIRSQQLVNSRKWTLEVGENEVCDLLEKSLESLQKNLEIELIDEVQFVEAKEVIDGLTKKRELLEM